MLDSLPALKELRIPSLPAKHSGQRLRSRSLRTLVLQYMDTAPDLQLISRLGALRADLPHLKSVVVEEGFFLDPQHSIVDDFLAWNR